jgi:hypothetical protein
VRLLSVAAWPLSLLLQPWVFFVTMVDNWERLLLFDGERVQLPVIGHQAPREVILANEQDVRGEGTVAVRDYTPCFNSS